MFVDLSQRTRAERKLRVQYATTRILAEAQTLADAAPRILQAVCEGLDWDLGALRVVAGDPPGLHCVALWHRPSGQLDRFAEVNRNVPFARGTGLAGEAWERDRPLWVEDLRGSLHLPRAALAVEAGLNAALAFPIAGRGAVLGVLEFFSREIPPPEDDLQHMMGSVCTQVGHFIERKRDEEALRTSEERYRAILQTAAEGILVVDADNKITFANQRMTRMLGFPQEEIVGQPFFTFIDAESQSMARACLRHNRQGAEEHIDFKFRRKDGSVVWTIVSASPVFDAQQSYLGALAMITDITERKELEARFLQAQKMEAVGRLAGGVAHDFNNLLTVITGYSDLALGTLHPEDPLAASLAQIKEAGQRAAALTRQLLAFSRKQVLAPELLDLNALVNQMLRMLHRLVGEDIELKTVLEPALGRVVADPGQVEQVLMNLVVNARDAMPQGGQLTIETANAFLEEEYAQKHPGVRPGRYVLLAVGDTGCGMDEQTKAHLFEPFFTTKGPEKGTGLGLATAYGIVKQSGGHIEVQSEPGAGTTFKIYLPRSRASIMSERLPAALSGRPQGSELVLLVEDDLSVRRLARDVLELHGYTVLEAGNGHEAIRLCGQTQRPIPLVITDVVMPDMGGRQLAAHLRAQRPQIKVLYLSGYTDEAVQRGGALEAGAPFLQKPFAPEALTRKVRQVLDRG